jgi:hypothetical protein
LQVKNPNIIMESGINLEALKGLNLNSEEKDERLSKRRAQEQYICGRRFDSRRLHQSSLKRSAKRRLPRRSHKAKTGYPDASTQFASL